MEGRVNVTVEPGATFTIHRLHFIYASKNYATVEIHPYSSGSPCIVPVESI